MSADNVERVRRALEAFNERNIEGMLAFVDPAIEFHSAFTAVGGADYDGHEGMRRWNRDFEDAWGEEVRVEPESFFDVGEHVLAYYVLRGRGRGSGVDVEMPVALVTRWRDDRITFMRGYAHREDALIDLGVDAGALEPLSP